MGIVSLIGIGMIVLGFAGVVACLVKALRVRYSKRNEAERRAALARLVPLNACSMGLSAIGAMIFAIGLLISRF